MQFSFGAEMFLYDALHSWGRSGAEWKFFFEKEIYMPITDIKNYDCYFNIPQRRVAMECEIGA